MKKYFVFIVMFLGCVITNADCQQVETIAAKVILQNTDGYFILSDKSCWKVAGFSKRWRGPLEWWNNVQLVPPNYECVPNDWFVGTQVAIYSKYDRLDVSESDASNQEMLKQCTHLFVNARTEQVLFAIAMEPGEGLTQLAKDMYKDGYDKGVSEGRQEANKNSTDSYNKGHAKGFREGHAKGLKEGYDNGYVAGKRGDAPKSFAAPH